MTQDWYLDTGATTRMTLNSFHLVQSNTYMGKDSMIVRNSASLPISYIGTLSPVLNVHLLNILIFLHLIKNLLSISKLISNFSLSIIFTDKNFTVQNCHTGRVVAINR